jgi:hypothetical protein
MHMSSTTKNSLIFLTIGIAISAFLGLILPSGSSLNSVLSIVAVVFVLLPLLKYAMEHVPSEDDDVEYFTAKSALDSLDTHRSLESTWLMLGNVFVANIFLVQGFGLWALWVPITWAFAFIVLSKNLQRIQDVPSATDSLHAFVGNTYESDGLKRVAAFVTLFTAVGIFAIEVTVGAALISSVFDKFPAAFAWPLILVCVAVMVVCAMTSGITGVVKADAVLFSNVVLVALVVLLLALFVGQLPRVTLDGSAIKELSNVTNAFTNSGKFEIAIFLLGIFFLQVPLLLADYGTWQRIRATKRSEDSAFKSRMLRMGFIQLILWGVPMAIGIALMGRAPSNEVTDKHLLEIAGPLIRMIQEVNDLGLKPFIEAVALFLLISGLLAIMVTTANSFLLVAIQTWVKDFFPSEATQPLVRAKRYALNFGVIGSLLAGLIYVFSYYANLVSLVFILFGSQVALVPAVVVALTTQEPIANEAHRIKVFTIAAYVLALCFGFVCLLISKDLGETAAWLRLWGPFCVPVIAFFVALMGCLPKSGQGSRVLAAALRPW